jgi:hypothetical protein
MFSCIKYNTGTRPLLGWLKKMKVVETYIVKSYNRRGKYETTEGTER